MCWKWGEESVNYSSVCHVDGNLPQKFVYPFNNYLVIAYYVAGTTLRVRDKRDKDPGLHEA